MAGPMDTMRVAQIGWIVRDVETAKAAMAEFLGMPVPPTCDGGGEYAYMDATKTLKCFIETLESY